MNWISNTGGLVYHFRAFRYSNALWRSHQDGLKKFLESWPVSTRTLVLIGPSGGYSLPFDFLARFESVIVYEPDPLARMILKYRMGKLGGFNIEWRQTFDFFSPPVFSKDASVLFCNLLGQIEVPNLVQLRKSLDLFLQGRSWASYHDWFSGPGIRFDGKDGVIADKRQGVTAPHAEITVNEHVGRSALPKASGRQVWDWQITPGFVHVIEAVWGHA